MDRASPRLWRLRGLRPATTYGDAVRRCAQALRDVCKHHGRHRGGRPSRRARAAPLPWSCWFPAAACHRSMRKYLRIERLPSSQNTSLIAQHCRTTRFVWPFSPGLSEHHSHLRRHGGGELRTWHPYFVYLNCQAIAGIDENWVRLANISPRQRRAACSLQDSSKAATTAARWRNFRRSTR